MLIDSSVWIELFEGSKKGEKAWKIISSNQCSISIISLTEIIKWCVKNKKEYKYRIEKIKQISTVINLNETISKMAGDNKINLRGIADSLIYSTARFYNLKLLTADNDFRNLSDVEMI